MEKKYQRKIRNFLINPGYQFRYVMWLTAAGLLLLGMNAWIFYRSISENFALLVELAPMTDESKNELFVELREILIKLGAVSLTFMLVVAVLGIVFSHRAAGPLYKFKKVFKEITDGDRDLRIHLRPGDEFGDVAEAFNEMMDSLTKKGP